MLENLGKPVIVTGSQIPAFETRSDGRENLVGALIIAGNFCIPEVGTIIVLFLINLQVVVYFNHKLLRGNRTIKMSANCLHAFDSPNLPPLAQVWLAAVVADVVVVETVENAGWDRHLCGLQEPVASGHPGGPDCP